MKNKALLIMLSAATVAAGCRMQESGDAPEPVREGSDVHFIATSDALTRSTFGNPDGSTYPTYWTGNETVAISLNYDEQQKVGVSVNETHTVAEFSYAPAEAASYTFYIVTPASALETPSPSREALRIAVPAAQKPLVNSVDEAAQVFYAKSNTTTQKPVSVNVRFNHLTAYGKLTLKHVTGTPVRLTLVADRPIAGSCYVAQGDGAVSTKDGSYSLYLDLTNLSVSGGNLNDVWFASLPADLAGKPLTVLLETVQGKTYKRTVSALGEAMKFVSGRIAKFSVDMASAEQVETAAAADVLNYDVYGAYIPGSPLLYDAASDQLSREYQEDGTVTFAVLDPSQDAVLEFSGIPEQAAYQDVFTLTMRYHSKGNGDLDATYNVTVVKEEGAKLWLSDGQNGFIVKR
jgi:hypothetical protein